MLDPETLENLPTPSRETSEGPTMEEMMVHPPETVRAAMEAEESRLEETDPVTAEALREARRTERRLREAKAETSQAEGTTSRTTPRRKNPPKTSSPSPSRSRSRSRTRAEVSEGEDGKPDLRSAVHALGEAAQDGAGRVKAPREDDWAEFLSVCFGIVSMLFVWWLCSGVGMVIGRQERDELELTGEEAEGLARPAARILARGALNARYGKHVLGSIDYLEMLVVLVAYTERVAPAVRRKMEAGRQPRRGDSSARDRRPHIVEEPVQRPAESGPAQWGIFGQSGT